MFTPNSRSGIKTLKTSFFAGLFLLGNIVAASALEQGYTNFLSSITVNRLATMTTAQINGEIIFKDKTVMTSTTQFSGGGGGVFITSSTAYIQNTATPTTTTQQFKVSSGTANVMYLSSVVFLGNGSVMVSSPTLLSLGTTNGLSLSANVLSLGTASSVQSGALTSADWTTFNNKQSTSSAATTYLTQSSASATYFPIVSSATFLSASSATLTYQPLINGTTGALPYIGTNGRLTFNATSYFWNQASRRLGIGTNNPLNDIHVVGKASSITGINLESNASTTNGSRVILNSGTSGGRYYSLISSLSSDEIATGSFYVRDNTTLFNPLIIDPNDNVSIGWDTTPINSSARLAVNGNLAVGSTSADAVGVFNRTVTVNPLQPNGPGEFNDGTPYSFETGDQVTYTYYAYRTVGGVNYYSSATGPNGLSIVTSGDYVFLNWEASAGGADGYKICRSFSGGSGDYTGQMDVGNTTTFSDTNVGFNDEACDVTPTTPATLYTKLNYDNGTAWGVYTNMSSHVNGNSDVQGNFGVGTSANDVKFHVLKGSPGTMAFPYESGVFENSGDQKLGVYTSESALFGNGSSLTFGETAATNGAGHLPGFELQNVNGSLPSNSQIKFTYLERDPTTGNVVGALSNVLRMYGDGTVNTSGGNTLDNGAGAATFGGVTDSALSSGRVVLAGTSGVLTSDSDLTFLTDTLTATKVVSTSATITGLNVITATVTTEVATNLIVTNSTMTNLRVTANMQVSTLSATNFFNTKFNYTFNAEQAKLPGTNPCTISNSTTAITGSMLCNDTTAQTVLFSTTLNYYQGNNLSADIYYTMVSTNSSNEVFISSVACVTNGDATVLDSVTFGTGASTTIASPGTIGYMKVATISGLNNSCARGDLIILYTGRNGASAADTATGDAAIRKITLYEP